MKKNWQNITIVISILLNVFQFISKEAREWYAVVQQSKPSVTNNKSLAEGSPVVRIEPKQDEIVKAEGIK